MNLKNILLGVIVVLILYATYSYFFNDHTSVDLVGLHNAKKNLRIEATSLPGNYGSVDYTFSIWIYINSWNYQYGEEKIILFRGKNVDNTDVKGSPKVTLDSNTNNLKIETLTYSTSDKTDPGVLNACSIPNIPIQKWVNILFTTNNKTMDAYLDGKLVKTCVLKGVPKMDKSAPLFLTPKGGFSGYTSRLKYLARTINPREAYEIYKDGYSDSLLGGILNKYKIKLSFLKGSEEISSLSL
jgi:hypothetical protein